MSGFEMHDQKHPERIVSLAGATLLAQGSVRQIWDRPDHPDQLLKTIQPRKIQKYEKKSAFRRAISDGRHGPYRSFKIEYWYYSRTAYRCIMAGISDQHIEWLNTLSETLYTVNISVPDLGFRNIVCDEIRGQFLVVDGYGDKAKLPFRSWIRSLNHKKLDKRFARMAVSSGLDWDNDQKRFSRP